ncbi:MAG: radical SAM protein [Minicystis sp.]
MWGREGLFALLGPEIAPGALVGEYRVVDAYPPAHVRRESAPMDLMLELRREADGAAAHFLFSQRDDSRPSLVSSAHLSFSHLSFGVAATPAVMTLQTMLALLLQLRDHEGISLRFPERLEAPAPPSLPLLAEPVPIDVPDTPGELNLVLTSDCAQSCTFCSVKGAWTQVEERPEDLARIVSDLERERRKGVRGVRLNGFDPLAHPRILDILRMATSLGYSSMDVYSPCTRLADRAFAESVVAAMPERRCFHVPLYGATAEMHDRVVGRQGAFALVMQALDHLTDLVGPEAIYVVTVLTVENLDGLPALAALASEREFALSAHFPFPTNPGQGDRFFRCAPRATDAATALARLAAAKGPAIPTVEGMAPCVLFRAMRAAGVPPSAWLDVPAERPLPMGAEYRDPHYKHGEQSVDFVAPTLPCPQAARCSLLPACSGELLQGYAQLYGTEEFRAVSLGELVGARSHGARR